ncbi:hypothetical protein LX32DRAFT_670465 [Colletotrichum zoysiae]|uniref:Uncharacterized protein n=1 Tax=Colletotrichum zoysiae TaxID=1216348 RepID=A0AAD9HRB2_9PEZI|nr:hypothetical protein LX32DRAFT_670465 [Colletotrichum zoysiae]
MFASALLLGTLLRDLLFLICRHRLRLSGFIIHDAPSRFFVSCFLHPYAPVPLSQIFPDTIRGTSFSVTDGGAPSSSPLDSTRGAQSKSGASLSEGGTAQASRVTTTPGQAVISTANSHTPGSAQVTDKDPFFSSATAEDSTIPSLPYTTVSSSHGTDRHVPTPEDSNDNKPTTASPGSTRVGGATSSSTASSTAQSVSPTSTAGPRSSASSGPISTASSTSSDSQEYATVLMVATSKPPEGVDTKSVVTWTSTEATKTTTRDGIAWPTIFPVWFCGGGQLLCPPKCLIPFISCGGLNLPGPLGFPWAKPRDDFRVDDELHHHLQHGHLQADRRLQQDPRHHHHHDLHHALGHADPGGALLRRQGVAHGFIAWNPAPDAALLDGPRGLTRPEEWPEGPQNWWDRMWKYVYHYCDGLTAPRLTLDGERLEMGYSTMHADAFGDRPLAGATGPFWGCSGVIIVTKRGIYTSHVWEIPNFHKGTHKPTALDWAAEFDEGILQFLKRGSGDRVGGYKGVEQLRRETRIFDNLAEDTLAVILHVPSSMAFAGSSQIPPNYGGFEPRHAALVGRWADFIADDLGFPRDKIRNNVYVKGPSYWPAYVQEKNPAGPMDMYTPPYGLLHWQYHPAHVVGTDGAGAEVRKPTIRVWYEKFLVFEESWCPPGAVGARDGEGAGSCPMPAAPGRSSPSASGGSASASGSASAPASASSSPISVSSGRGSASAPADSRSGSSSASASAGPPANGASSNAASRSAAPSSSPARPSTSSSPQAKPSPPKPKATVWHTVTITPKVTVAPKVTPKAPATSPPKPSSTTKEDTGGPGGPGVPRIVWAKRSGPLPGPGRAPSRRRVRITQEMASGGGEAGHAAVVAVYDVSGDQETLLVSQRHGKGGGGPADLPGLLTVKDQDGGRLDVKFNRDMQQIELESSRRGRTEQWTLMSIRDEENPGRAYCQIHGVTAGGGVPKRSVDCFYSA